MNKIEKLINKLCPDGVEYKTIIQLCDINRGRTISKDYLRKNPGNYPVYSSQTENNGIFGYINSYDYDLESITWTTDGAKAGSVFYHNNEKFSITNICGLLKITNKDLIPKFLYYILKITAKSYVSPGMGNPKLMSNVMEQIPIPIPPISIQKKIVKILDKFTELEIELEKELEKELKLRKKQYEYYRNQLLTPVEINGKWYLNGKEVKLKELWEVTLWDKRFNSLENFKQPKILSFKHLLSSELKSLNCPDGNIKLLPTGKFEGYTSEDIASDYINEGEIIALPSGGSANIKYYKGKFVDSGNILGSSLNNKILNLILLLFSFN